MARIVPAGTAGVARCASIGTQLATTGSPPQPTPQPPRNIESPRLYDGAAPGAQQEAQQPRNSGATVAAQIGVQELRSSILNLGADAPDLFAPEFTADPETYQRWVVTIPGRDPFAVIATPSANLAQMRALYSTASSIIPDTGDSR